MMKNSNTMLKISAVLLILISSCFIVLAIQNYKGIELEKPYLSITNKDVREHPSPFDRIKEDQIHVYSNRVVIDIDNVEWSRFSDTNSMDPVIDNSANAIQIVPETPEDIHVGDIVSYKSDYSDGIIIHRVYETGYDEIGWYAIMKGDNISQPDPGKVRFNQVKRVVIGIIY